VSEFLIVHYKPGLQSSMHSWALGGDAHPSITLGQGSLEELTPLARGKKVTVLIDSHFTTLQSVNIPSKNRSKQLQAIPFAMEDNLAEDIDDTHFALGKQSAEQSSENKIPVIAIKRTLLQQTLAVFNQQNIHIDVMSADSVALPNSANQWCILLDEYSALIKTSASQAHSCDRENAYVILQSLLQAEKETENLPEKIIFYYKEGDEEAQTLFDDIDIEVEVENYKNNNLEIFIQHLSDVPSFNLLQGEFSPKRESNAWLQPWKSVAAIAAFWLFLQLSFDAVLGTQLKQENIALTKKIETEFKRAIPDARKMTNMQKRVERRLNDLKSGGSGSRENGFLQLLSKTSSALSEKDKITIKAAVYRNNYIDVDLTAKTLQDIEQIKNKLEKLPGIKTVLSTTVEKNSVKGRLRLEAKG